MMLPCSVVIPTFFTGKIIENLFNSIPKVKEILVFDNSNDKELEELIKINYPRIKYIPTGDIGLAKTYNEALKKTSSQLMFITQPDVILENNCIENLLIAKKKYDNAALLAPLLFENNVYSKYDHYDLRINKKKDILNLKFKNFKNIFPSGDFVVEAINSTAVLIDKDKIENIKGWDDYYYTYLEDIDLCYRVRKKNYEIIKVKNARANHLAFKSHKPSKHEQINIKRVFNFSKSSIYFDYKNRSKLFFFSKTFKNFIKTFFKLIISLILVKKKKIKVNLIKIKAYYYFFYLEKFGKINIQMKED